MRRPLIIAVDGDRTSRNRLRQELDRRYGSDYSVQANKNGADALADLAEAHTRGDRVALVLADQWLPDTTGADMSGSELLARVRRQHPDAKRALLVKWGAWADRDTAEAILSAMALGDINYYVLKPWTSPDELFHRTITDFLHEWARSDLATQREVVVVADRRSSRGHQIRSLLTRNGIPHAFHDRASSQGEAVLAHVGQGPSAGSATVWLPVLSGRVLVDPTDAEIVAAWGIPTSLAEDERDFDVVVVGAGPAGLAAAVYASSEGLRSLIVERESIGGQAGASSLIRNYLGFSRGLSGAELAQRGYQQAWVFGAHFLLTREVTSVRHDADRFALSIDDVGEVTARTVLLATGVSYRRLNIPELEALSGAGVFYGASVSEAQAMTGRCAVVIGGGNSAGQAALHLSRYARRVMLVVRASALSQGMSDYLSTELESAPGVEIRTGAEIAAGGGTGRLEYVVVRDRASGSDATVDADGLFVMIGAKPHTQWLPEEVRHDSGGFLSVGSDVSGEDWPLERAPFPYETSLPGLFAVGDVRSGSVKRVASAVGEGSVVVSQVHDFLQAPAERHERPQESAAGMVPRT